MNLLTANHNNNILCQNSASNSFLASRRSPGLGMLVVIDPRVENYGMLISGVPLNLEFNDSNQQNVTVTGVDDGNFNIFHSATVDGIDPNLLARQALNVTLEKW